MHMSFGGLHGRGAKKQDPPIERELVLALEEVFHGCTKKMKISRRVKLLTVKFMHTKQYNLFRANIINGTYCRSRLIFTTITLAILRFRS